MNDDTEWMSPAGAAATLRRSERQLRNYAQQGKLRTRRRGPGGRVEYLAADVQALAAEMQVERDLPRAETVEIVPSTQLAAQLERLHVALRDAEVRAAQAEQALRLLPPPEEARALQAEAAEARAEVRTLRELLAEARGTSRAAWRVALIALAVALVAVVAVVALALIR
jgi:DNA-binding transcriptional MerR regulator